MGCETAEQIKILLGQQGKCGKEAEQVRNYVSWQQQIFWGNEPGK
jgi:hypothetical protein